MEIVYCQMHNLAPSSLALLGKLVLSFYVCLYCIVPPDHQLLYIPNVKVTAKCMYILQGYQSVVHGIQTGIYLFCANLPAKPKSSILIKYTL